MSEQSQYNLVSNVVQTYTKFFYIDIDECEDNNGGCEVYCINTNGSYYCDCNIGYYVTADNRSCAGILEQAVITAA